MKPIFRVRDHWPGNLARIAQGRGAILEARPIVPDTIFRVRNGQFCNLLHPPPWHGALLDAHWGFAHADSRASNSLYLSRPSAAGVSGCTAAQNAHCTKASSPDPGYSIRLLPYVRADVWRWLRCRCGCLKMLGCGRFRGGECSVRRLALDPQLTLESVFGPFFPGKSSLVVPKLASPPYCAK